VAVVVADIYLKAEAPEMGDLAVAVEAVATLTALQERQTPVLVEAGLLEIMSAVTAVREYWSYAIQQPKP
jgi:hypothetical protein